MHRLITYLVALFLLSPFAAIAANPKYEFRGAWIHTIGQNQYAQQSTAQNKKYISDMLDKLQAAGINAVLFQVRPSADAFYDSNYEPWSRYITSAGKAPVPFWDPLDYFIQEAHARGMELHAWLNPYRVTTAKGQTLPKGHIYHKDPNRFIKFNNQIYFDPGQPANRKHIVKVVEDIVNRYDVDGIHFDDYFYPYPVAKQQFMDNASYKKYGKGMKKADWRRHNVDMLIQEVHESIRASKRPWVRFGISPFGIWRNKASDPKGSATNGLQNYDDLYADVLLWAKKGWIDYLIPQLYWELEHKKASSLKLVDWWNEAVDSKCHVYIGQDVERSMKTPDVGKSKEKNQLTHKVNLTRQRSNIMGNCYWPGYSLVKDAFGSSTLLKKDLQSTPAIVPSYPEISTIVPKAPKIKLSGRTISWKAETKRQKASDVVRYVVYRFKLGAKPDFDNPKHIMAITADPSIDITKKGQYAVTALDRVNNESKPSNIIEVK